jgi:hypothetical protein
VDAEETRDEKLEPEREAPAARRTRIRARVLDAARDVDADPGPALDEPASSEVVARPQRPERRTGPQLRRASARLAWLEDQLEVRDDAIRQRVPEWTPGSADILAEQAVIMAFDEILSEHGREVGAAELARQQAKVAHGKGVEAGAVGAVVVLGLIASGVALVYAGWQAFVG